MLLTKKTVNKSKERKTRNAVILAAGFGMRMIPINLEIPKGLLEINGEPLIERQIKQLHEVGIHKIYIVVGFMKECYEYLIDEYGVELIVNAEYAVKNNLYSLYLAKEKIYNTYIIPCDIWCKSNPFQINELYSWYMINDTMDKESTVRVNCRFELVTVDDKSCGNGMLGICYLMGEEARIVRTRLGRYSSDAKYDGCFWEETLLEKGKWIVKPKKVNSDQVTEINTYEQLRELDGHSNQLRSDALETVANVLQVNTNDICHISVLKKGMTNRSFLFECNHEKYIMRIPGEGTDQLINRREEADVYQRICDKEICDDVIYINAQNGYKITKYLTDARVCDPENLDDLKKCMKKLRDFHEHKLKVDHYFDIFGQIDFYESLWNGKPSVYRDYQKTKESVFSLRQYILENAEEAVLTHIDAVPDNFLFVKDKDGKEDIRLIDWEYAGMQDPHVDIAMFCIYAMYNRTEIDRLIDIYFENKCPEHIRTKIYCYVAMGGLLWSNWCEYKRNLGIDFGEYSLKQYRYAKEYYKIAKERIEEKNYV